MLRSLLASIRKLAALLVRHGQQPSLRPLLWYLAVYAWAAGFMTFLFPFSDWTQYVRLGVELGVTWIAALFLWDTAWKTLTKWLVAPFLIALFAWPPGAAGIATIWVFLTIGWVIAKLLTSVVLAFRADFNLYPRQSENASAVAARQRYEARLRAIDSSAMDAWEKRAARDYANQQYLRAIDEVMR